MAHNHAWERVLAAIEADALRAEAMLRAEAPEPDLPVEALAEPGWFAPPTVLPPLTEMPELPADLRERVVALRNRIDALSAELADVLRDWPNAAGALAARRPLVASAARVEPSRYVDRRV